MVAEKAASGGYETVFSIRNYSLSDNQEKQYESVYSLSIGYSQCLSDETIFNRLLYLEIDGIKELYVNKEIQDKAEKKY